MKEHRLDQVAERWSWTVPTACLLALLFPVLVAPLPPLTDYPNHLARLWLLSATVPPMPEVYVAKWDTLTNIGMDLLGVALSRVTDTWTAGRLIVALATMLVPLGGMLLWRLLHGKWHWWQASFAILAWSFSLLNGFLNFHIGLGLALLGAALDLVLTRRSVPVAVAAAARIAVGFATLLMHPFGFVFYALLLTGIDIGPHLPHTRPEVAARIRSLSLIGVTLVIPLVLFLVLSPRLPAAAGHSGIGGVAQEFLEGLALAVAVPWFKLGALAVAIRTYSNPADVLVVLCLVLPVIVAVLTRQLRFHAGMLATVALCLIAFAICPWALASGLWVDTRFSIMAPLALALALRPDLQGGLGRFAATVLVAGALGRTALIGTAWHARQADFAAVERALERVPPGTSVFAVEHRIGRGDEPPLGRYLTIGDPTMRHAVTLAIPWRRAFVPTLFAIPGQQPVRVLPPWDALATPAGGTLASVDVLSHPEKYAALIAGRPYLRSWREQMDYVLVINADMPDMNGPFTPPPQLRLLADEGFAQLFQVVR